MTGTPRATAEITTDEEGISVTVAWDVEVDRNRTYGCRLRPDQTAVAQRLKRAIDAQVVCLNPFVRRDNGGKTYVSADNLVMGRTLAADLRRLGY